MKTTMTQSNLRNKGTHFMLQITGHPWETSEQELPQKPWTQQKFSPRLNFSHLSYKVHARMPGVPPTGPSYINYPNQPRECTQSHPQAYLIKATPQLRLTQITLGCIELRVEANKLEGCAVLEKKICLWVIVRYWRHKGKGGFNATIVPLHNGPKILEKLDGHSVIWGMGRN